MNLQIGVKVIIKNTDGAILLMRRGEKYGLTSTGELAWDIPGGRIGVEERLDEALVREVKEEIGVELTGKPTLLAAQDIIVPEKEMHVVRLTYLHAIETKDITLSDEHSEYTWMSLEDAQNEPIEPYLRAVLDSL